MARPRLHPPGALLDAAEELVIERGRANLTVRALAGRAGVPNGSIYHAFGSVDDVVARTWLHRARQFLEVQRTAVEAELDAGDPVAAVRAAADSPARLHAIEPSAARLLTELRRDDLLTDGVPEAVVADLRGLDRDLAAVLRRLARAVWDRTDRAAVDVVTICVVQLPAALVLPEIRAGRVQPLTRRRLAAAVGAVLDCPLDP
ncbi:TetR/AcrR family transcriptional regulator [Blastococcus tunisiensis]|uniref:DNA-binding transcriptional regulator, AcrR family n=1 Tax=Blastococcus tunisiensis TaxID=1798228 RepID=A0A1I2JWZ3_9ACTN|nr:TetR/AcrR family transcriptional regulator [Blastococcus sp. DSM 46838]SFF58598.1 DNA-binding transcriptional regulator, AcrR family [Blastococcus sp. DSM 46838]